MERMMTKRKKLTNEQRAERYAKGRGREHILLWPLSSCMEAYLAGLRAGRREKP